MTKPSTSLPVVALSTTLEKSLSSGHPWIYRDHLPKTAQIEHGAFVELRAGGARAFALYDAESAIALRVFSTRKVPDDEWLRERVELAFRLREPLRRGRTSAYRWIFGEGDQLPGITVDLYGEYAVIVSYASSLERLIAPVAKALTETTKLLGVVRRLPSQEGGARLELVSGRLPPARFVVEEHGARFYAELEKGQKTGLFLDQRENRRFIAAMASGLRVLNLFSYTGGFSVHAALAGASRVVSVDASAGALETAKDNFRLNGLDPDAHGFETADVFAYLQSAISRAERHDIVISDPPSFAKSRAQQADAIKAYKRLNADGLRTLKPEGIYAAGSCTSQVCPDDFRDTLAESARRAKCELQILGDFGQPLDHPVLAQHPEGRYLKFIVGRALKLR
jgi:23S rRNA (cytosine1962-C5)-methyltransferase